MLLTAGYTTTDPLEGETSHIHFYKSDVLVELHRRYALLNSQAAIDLLDSWVFEAIPHAVTVTFDEWSFPILPEPLNGLTLLAHISQHLEEGLGLRWCLGVDDTMCEALTDYVLSGETSGRKREPATPSPWCSATDTE